MQPFVPADIMQRLRKRFYRLYGDASEPCMDRLRTLIGRYGVGMEPEPVDEHWNQTDSVLITYADMVRTTDEKPLATLKRFLDKRLAGLIRTVHVLPFFPYSSDEGFSVIDYREVHHGFGSWKDIEALGERFDLMFDLVLNHVSRRSDWFRQFCNGILPASKYFIEADPETDLSAVTRPRASPLLTQVNTRDGEKHVWTTFSEDQIDLDFSNPDVLFEFLDLLVFYIARGVRILRLDAIAYLWKKIGTSCIHLPETHEVVKLLRDVVELVAPRVLLLTETNVPNEENISYFGDGDEAHMVYQFSLPPLLLHALHTGNARYLNEWAMSLPVLQPGTTFFNFTASHDGVGVRPLEGLIPDEEFAGLLAAVQKRGGHVSTKRNTDGSESPYELNISYFDALSSPGKRVNPLDISRFLCSQTVALSLKGIPGIYFHSLMGTRNDYDGVERYGYPRAINRHRWDADALSKRLSQRARSKSRVFQQYTHLLRVRREEDAFHPDGLQSVLNLGPELFAVARVAPDGGETIVAVHNLQAAEVRVARKDVSRLGDGTWHDLIADAPLPADADTLVFEPYQCVWLKQQQA